MDPFGEQGVPYIPKDKDDARQYLEAEKNLRSNPPNNNAWLGLAESAKKSGQWPWDFKSKGTKEQDEALMMFLGFGVGYATGSWALRPMAWAFSKLHWTLKAVAVGAGIYGTIKRPPWNWSAFEWGFNASIFTSILKHVPAIWNSIVNFARGFKFPFNPFYIPPSPTGELIPGSPNFIGNAINKVTQGSVDEAWGRVEWQISESGILKINIKSLYEKGSTAQLQKLILAKAEEHCIKEVAIHSSLVVTTEAEALIQSLMGNARILNRFVGGRLKEAKFEDLGYEYIITFPWK